MMLISMSIRVPIVVVLACLASQAVAQDQLGYVKKATREESRRASLDASGQSVWPGQWHLIGPFENKGIKQSHPPEEEIHLDATYPGKGEEAVWRPFEFPDGKVHSLKKFKSADNCVCYLYRQLEVPKKQKARVSLGS